LRRCTPSQTYALDHAHRLHKCLPPLRRNNVSTAKNARQLINTNSTAMGHLLVQRKRLCPHALNSRRYHSPDPLPGYFASSGKRLAQKEMRPSPPRRFSLTAPSFVPLFGLRSAVPPRILVTIGRSPARGIHKTCSPQGGPGRPRLPGAVRTRCHLQCRSGVPFGVLIELPLPLSVGDLGCS